MSTRMPPRGGAPQRPPYRPPASVRKKAGASRERRRVFDIVVFIVVIALVAVFARQLGAPSSNANAGATQGASGKPAGTALPSGEQPLITELVSSNKGSITDWKGEYCDWIEIYNPTGNAINMAGFALSDNMKQPAKFVMPFYMLEPGQYMIVYADGGASTETEIHAGFKLKNASQEELLMTDPSGNVIQQVLFPTLQENCSYALDPATNQWAPTDKYTPGFANNEEGWAAYQQTRRATEQVALTEVMAGNTLTLKDKDGEYSDWLEIHNPTDKPIDITGWGLSNKEAVPKRWVFPKTVLEPGQYIVVFCSGKNHAVEGEELHTDFRLNAFQETVLLSNLRGQIVNGSQVQINRQNNDESFGRVPGSDTWQPFAHPTPGHPNDEAGWNEFQKTLYADAELGPVIINELMGNNTRTLKDQFGEYPDWIELYNRSDSPVNLKGWGLTDEPDELGRWQFPDYTLGPGKYVTVFASGRNLTDSDAVSKKKLHTDFGISSGGIVALTTPDGAVADRCFVPILRAGLSYDRPEGSMLFGYSTEPTPNAANTGNYPGMAPEPAFSLKAGLYDAEQSVELTVSDPEAKIYYTLDGDPPSQSDTLYTGPITVSKPTGVEFGATVIRAAAFREGYLPSNTTTSTYIVGQDIDLPVLSIAVDNEAMFNERTGMYEQGNPYEKEYPFHGANFWKDMELPANIELLEPDGTVGISQEAGIQIAGDYSRGDVFKAFDIIARSEYGKNSFDHQIFPDQPYKSYKAFISRPGGQDVKFSGMRDILVISLARDTIPKDNAIGGPSVYTQDVRLALEFVNGEFWGVTTLHEKIDEHTLAQNYHVNESSIDLIDLNGKAKFGSSKDYSDLVSYAKTHDLSNPENYKYVSDRMDIDGYINYCTMEIVIGNSDYGNIRIWKSSDLDNKFHWIYYDFCWTFWPGFLSSSDDRYMSDLSLYFKSKKSSHNKALLNALIANPEFKDKFIKQLAYNLNVTYETDRTLQRIDEIATDMRPYMNAEYAKWHDISYLPKNKNAQGYAKWEDKVEGIRKYARQHPAILKQEMKNYFNLTDADMKRLFPNG